MFRIIITFLLLSIVGCTSGYHKFYKPYIDIKNLSNPTFLKKDEELKIFETNNFDRDIRILRARKFIPLGYSSFNGEYEDINKAKAQARRIGATIILTNSTYTGTQTTTSTLLLPDTKTTYYTGSMNTNSTYSNNYGDRVYVDRDSGYNGTSTTHGTIATPITTHQRRYDQNAVYLVKINPKMKFGVSMKNLTPEMREQYERNIGVYIDIVFEESAAFNSNILPGDIITDIDGIKIKNTKHALTLIADIPKNATSSKLNIIRKGHKKTININF